MKRILWLSDIHLNGKGTERKTEKLIRSFISWLQASSEQIDILVVSGDIAKSGSERVHYNKFQKLLIEPIQELFPEIKMISVPGNHDVNWKNTQKELVFHVVNNPGMADVLRSFKNKIDSDYFFDIFNHYERFHEATFTNSISDTFSNLTLMDDIAVVTLNSAWLSIGNPVKSANINTRVVNKVQNLSIVDENSTRVLFEELGNQTYGFTIPEAKKKLDEIYDELTVHHREKFKILVVHHPPNNWLHWQELYSEKESEKSDFHNFIVDADIDLILCGHEHTSLVEGGLLYGRSLVLYAGMFLDHHEADYSNSWFKILELGQGTTPAGTIINEKWYHYSGTDGGRWREKEEFSMQYSGWQGVSKRLYSDESPKKPYTPLRLKTMAGVKKYVVKTQLTQADETLLLKLAGFVAENKQTLLVPDFPEESLKMISNKNNALFVVNNLDDLFKSYEEELPKNSYIYRIIEKLKEKTYEAIFIFYLYEDSKHQIKDADRKMIDKAVQSKFEQFRHLIFKLPNVLINLKNANFAIRKKI
jgi:predicted MPP superfamily phosphohydrolase